VAGQQILGRPTLLQRGWLLSQLRDETVGGAVLLAAAAIALIWANSPAGDSYTALISTPVGPASIGPVPLDLDLPIGIWAADALLAIFFFIVGLELKHELVLGSLSRLREAVVPAAAALGGMIVPAVLFVMVNLTVAGGNTAGWGIPMATDIAFALAVLAVLGRSLPVALRAFLLTLAVVDDLGAIAVIAIFYSDKFQPWWFLAALGCLLLYAAAQRARITSPFVYVPLVISGWLFTYYSGVHATVAGVAFGLLTRVRCDPGEQSSPVDRLNRRIHPISAGVAVPIFAFCAAGVDLRAIGIGPAITSPIAIGIIIGLVLGKPIGVVGATWLTARFTRAQLHPSIAWRDIGAIGLLAGIGFTVALLITELAYEDQVNALDSAKIAVLLASVLAAAVAGLALLSRNRHYARVAAVEERDEDRDGIPDVYQQPPDR
jgi:NhaA family Na+:H+ antiporter